MANPIEQYRREVDAIEAGEEFKDQTKAMLLAALAEQADTAPPEAEKPEEAIAAETQAPPPQTQKPGPGQTVGTPEAEGPMAVETDKAPAEKDEAPPAGAPQKPKKYNTVRPGFTRWLRPAMAAAAIVLVATVALRAINSGQRYGENAEMAMAYDAPADAAGEAWDDGADMDEAELEDAPAMEAEMATADSTAATGYFARDAYADSRSFSTLPESFTVGGMENLTGGFQGITLYSFSEFSGLLLGGEEIPSTLPIYRNTAQRGTEYARTDGQSAKLEALGYQTLAGLGLELDRITYREQDTLSSIEFICEGATVSVYADESLRIAFDEPRQIGGISLTAESTAAQWEALAAETVYQYHSLFSGLEEFGVEALFERDFTGGQAWHVSVYDAAGELADVAASRSLRGARLAYDETGRLTGLTLYRNDDALLGAYPTISLAEATEALAGGHSVTTVPYDFPGTGYIKGVDLVYLATGYEESFLPFYLFYVALPDGQGLAEGADEGLVCYGMWYVPAINGVFVNNADGDPFFGTDAE